MQPSKGRRPDRKTSSGQAPRSFNWSGQPSTPYASATANTTQQLFASPNTILAPVRPESSMSGTSFAPFTPFSDGGVPLWSQYSTPQLGNLTPNANALQPYTIPNQNMHVGPNYVYGQTHQQRVSPQYVLGSQYGSLQDYSCVQQNLQGTGNGTLLPNEPRNLHRQALQDVQRSQNGYTASHAGSVYSQGQIEQMADPLMDGHMIAKSHIPALNFSNDNGPARQKGPWSDRFLTAQGIGKPNYGLGAFTAPVNSTDALGSVASVYQNTSLASQQGMSVPAEYSGELLYSQNVTTTALTAIGSSGHSTRAKELAALITSGYFTILDDPVAAGMSGRRTASSMAASISSHQSRCTTQLTSSTPSKAILPSTRPRHVRGNPATFVAVEAMPPPEWFGRVAEGFRPSVEDVLDQLPFVEACRMAMPSDAGVVRINNIPYNTPRSELTAFVGRNAQVVSQPLGSPYFAVHVIMERHSGKAMDAFIELSSPAEAALVVNQFQRRINDGRPPRIGDRSVYVEFSSQEELMAELFPRAKKVVWDGCIPHIQHEYEEYYPGVPAMGFNGFLQNEEIVMMTRHVESPMRSPFANRCPVRAYESLISTLHKYPWFALEHVTLNERRSLYEATLTTVRALINFLRRGEAAYDRSKPTSNTLQELVVACLTCPGFSEQQKMGVVMLCNHGGFGHVTNARGMNLVFGGTFPLAAVWPFQALVKAPGANEQFMTYVACLLCEATLSSADGSTATTNNPFGPLQIDYERAETMDQAGRAELRAIEAALSRILPRSRTPLASSADTPTRPPRTAWSASVASSSRGSFTTYSV